MLWTRVTTDGTGPVTVTWEVATEDDDGFAAPVAGGETTTSAATDHTVRVDATGLTPGVEYRYRFHALGATSTIGRTRLWPADRTSLRIGVAACAFYRGGWFNVYRRLAERDDLDLVLHLGDYIYEYPDDMPNYAPWNIVPERHQQPNHELFTLEDYRSRHALVSEDPDLQALHARHPTIHLWEDHEIVNDCWTFGCPDADAMPVTWEERKAGAVRAFWEWVPVRWPETGVDEAFADPATTHQPRLYRQFSFGELADLVVIDTRHEGREEVREPLDEASWRDPERRIMTDTQHDWLVDALGASTARWRLLANPSMLAPLAVRDLPEAIRKRMKKIGSPLGNGAVSNPGQWDGYPAHRERLFADLAARDVADLVVLTGDIHSAWVSELGGEVGGVGVEFVTPSVATRSLQDLIRDDPAHVATVIQLIEAQHPWVRWFDLDHHGYIVLDVEPDRVRATWWLLDTVLDRDHEEWVGAAWEVHPGDPRLHEVAR